MDSRGLRIFFLLAMWLVVSPLRAEEVSVQLPWLHQFEFAAFYAAEEQGFYHDEGLDVVLHEGGPGVNPVAAVLSGRVDFALGSSGLIVDRGQGKSVVAVAALVQHSPVALLAAKTTAVKTVKDLANQPIAVDVHNQDEIEAYLLESGIDKSQIKLVTQTDATLNTLESGLIAAKVIFTTNEPFLIQDQLNKYLIFRPQATGIDFFGSVLFSSQAYLLKHPDTAEAFRAATLKGLAYALEHPDEIVQLILDKYNTQHKSRAHLLFEAEAIKTLTRTDIVEVGHMSVDRWQHVAQVYQDLGKLPLDFTLDGFLYTPAHDKTPIGLMLAVVVMGIVLALFLWLSHRLHDANQHLKIEIEERHRTEQSLAISEANYRELVDNANVIILRLAFDGTITYFNAFAEKFFGYTQAEILGKHVMDTIVPNVETGTERDLSALINQILQNPNNFQVSENENITKSGKRVWVQWSNKVLFDEQGKAVGVLSIGHDVTEKRATDLQIHQLAFFDSLTGLPNRQLMLDRLQQSIAKHHQTGLYGALLFIDLDHFKLLNDTHGHHLGDQLLIQVANRLMYCLSPGDMVARLGGDEFVMVYESLSADPRMAAMEAETRARGCLQALTKPFMLGTLPYELSASIGITLFKDNQDHISDLLKRADMAMYQVKSSGRNGIRFFDPLMQSIMDSQSELQQELRHAIESKEFFVLYQPQVDQSGKLLGVEALVRWRHATKGVLLPFVFLDVAEETGLIREIGREVLLQASHQLAAWQAQTSHKTVTVSVNISAVQFSQDDFVEQVTAILKETGANPAGLILEVTESLLLDNVETVTEKMKLLKKMGVRFSIDDFGTGYCSLIYLKYLPIDELKIDKSFMCDIVNNDNAKVIVKAFIQLAHSLGLCVVAEGVETTDQRDWLEQHQCNRLQGYLFGKPMLAEQLN